MVKVDIKLGQLERLNDIISHIFKYKLNAYEAFKVLKLARAIEEDLRNYISTLDNLKKQYAEHDEEGKLCSDDNGLLVFSGDNREKYITEAQNLANSTVTISVPRLSMNSLLEGGVKLRPTDILVLEPVLNVDVQDGVDTHHD